MRPVAPPRPRIRLVSAPMAFEFHITEARWSNRRLRAFFDAWLPKVPVPLLGRTRWQRGATGPGTWLFAEGSIRGCSLDLVGGVLQPRSVRVRLNLMASRIDWQLGQALVRALLDAGGGKVSGAGGEVLGPELLREPEASVEAHAHMRDDAIKLSRELRGGRSFAALPNPEFSLLVTPGLLPDDPDTDHFALELQEELIEMAARYHGAEAVGVMQLPDASTLSIWQRGDSLVHASHFIGVSFGDDPDDGVVLPGQDLIALLGSRVEIVSENQDRFYFPALDLGEAEDQKLLEDLRTQGQQLGEWLQRFPS